MLQGQPLIIERVTHLMHGAQYRKQNILFFKTRGKTHIFRMENRGERMRAFVQSTAAEIKTQRARETFGKRALPGAGEVTAYQITIDAYR